MLKTSKLLFVGDVVLNSKPVFTPKLKDLFQSADLRVCNFEAPLKGAGKPILKTGPHVAQDPEAVAWLKQEGFNLFSLANNHILDYGDVALQKTIAAIGADNCLGAGDAKQAYACHTLTIKDTLFGFMAFGENGFGALNGDRDYGHAWVNDPQVETQIKEAAEKVDVLILQVHAGVELLDVPIPEWRTRYKQLLDAGADAVVAHHPHVLQGMEYHENKPIFYSLGNFYFDYPSNHPQWNTGGLLELRYEGKKLLGFTMHVVKKTNNKLDLGNENEAEKMMADLNVKLNIHSYEDYVTAFAVQDWDKHHIQYYAKPFNGLGKYNIKALLKHVKRSVFNREVDYHMLWHNLFIESNKWLVERAIRYKLKAK